MGEQTAISWCDHTFNPWMGCTKLSPACDGCYAEALMDKRYGKVQWGPHGERVRTSASNWQQPRRWNKRALEAGTRPFVFCASLADVFDNQVDPAWRADLFALIRETPQLVWLLLTKRPQNIAKQFREALSIEGGDEYMAHLWPRNAAIGTTVEDQERADTNVPALLAAKAQLRPAFAFLSCEPLLGPVDLGHIHRSIGGSSYETRNAFNWHQWEDETRIDWVITGGETDQGSHRARPTHPDWFRALRDQCAAAGVPFHHKQNGEWDVNFDPDLSRSDAFWLHADGVQTKLNWTRTGSPDQNPVAMFRRGKAHTSRLLDGIEHDARPTLQEA